MLSGLATESEWKLSKEEMKTLIVNAKQETGIAEAQVVTFAASVEKLLKDYPEAKSLEPGAIL